MRDRGKQVIDWSKVDWSKSDWQLSFSLGVSRAWVCQMRNKLKAPKAHEVRKAA
jgi:hypothetical protein